MAVIALVKEFMKMMSRLIRSRQVDRLCSTNVLIMHSEMMTWPSLHW